MWYLVAAVAAIPAALLFVAVCTVGAIGSLLGEVLFR